MFACGQANSIRFGDYSLRKTEWEMCMCIYVGMYGWMDGWMYVCIAGMYCVYICLYVYGQ